MRREQAKPGLAQRGNVIVHRILKSRDEAQVCRDLAVVWKHWPERKYSRVNCR